MFFGTLIVFQGKLIYIPEPDPKLAPRRNRFNPLSFGGIPYEDIQPITTDGVQVHGWLLKQDTVEATKAATTVLYFHGNAGNISLRLPLFAELRKTCKVNILAADYRGFGDSGDAAITQKGLEEDAYAFFKAAVEHELINSEKIIVFGKSLGAAVAIHLQHRLEVEGRGDKIKGLIVENTFSSIKDIALVLFPFLKPFERILKPPVLTEVWDNYEKMQSIKPKKMMFVSGRKDELIPPAQIDSLIATRKRCGFEDDLFFVLNGMHNDTPIKAGIEYYRRLLGFINQTTK
eukprot:snap_masked-scaffold_5-processed-gene-15.44-mRNA-1 protein AED:0.06 eAED:0.06 QI:0/0/0/0.33/1/1/3/0/288